MDKLISHQAFQQNPAAFLSELQQQDDRLLLVEAGKPVFEIKALGLDALLLLRGSVLRYDEPFEPTGETWNTP